MKAPHLPILKLTRESSTDDNVVILRVTIKNEVLIGRVLERKSYLCPLRTRGVGATGSGRNWPGTLSRENWMGLRSALLVPSPETCWFLLTSMSWTQEVVIFVN